MVQWLPIHQMSMMEIKVITKTFKTVFPNTSLRYGMVGDSVPVVGLFGTEDELNIEMISIEKKYNNSSLVKSKEEVGLDNPVLELINPKLFRDLGKEKPPGSLFPDK